MRKFLIKVNGIGYEVEVEENASLSAMSAAPVAAPAAPAVAAAPAAAPAVAAAPAAPAASAAGKTGSEISRWCPAHGRAIARLGHRRLKRPGRERRWGSAP